MSAIFNRPENPTQPHMVRLHTKNQLMLTLGLSFSRGVTLALVVNTVMGSYLVTYSVDLKLFLDEI
jgi:hypothetical protein